MSITNKLVHFKTKQKFNEELTNRNILETSIVFILDTKEIYTHGLFYDGKLVDLSNIETSILNILDNYATKEEIPTKVSQLENDSGFFTTEDTDGSIEDVGDTITLEQLNTALLGKQDTLISGTNIKTINGTSILGSGNIVIEGGSSSGGSSAYAEVNHGTSDTTFTLTPNTFHIWDEVASLDLSFADETAGVANEYLFQFTSGATATTLTLPDVKWANELTIADNMIYQISILKGLASVLEFENEVPSGTIIFFVNGEEYEVDRNMTWGDFINSEYNPDVYSQKMFIDEGYIKYAAYIYAEDDIEYTGIYTPAPEHNNVYSTDTILPLYYELL